MWPDVHEPTTRPLMNCLSLFLTIWGASDTIPVSPDNHIYNVILLLSVYGIRLVRPLKLETVIVTLLTLFYRVL